MVESQFQLMDIGVFDLAKFIIPRFVLMNFLISIFDGKRIMYINFIVAFARVSYMLLRLLLLTVFYPNFETPLNSRYADNFLQ